MATIGSAAKRLQEFRGGLQEAVLASINRAMPQMADAVRAQLYCGMDGDDNPLRPGYVEDPWFDSDAARGWKGKARNYRAWKRRITPPKADSQYGLPARDQDTPNLFINGYYHSSVKAEPIDLGATITATAPFAPQILEKYGPSVLKIGPGGRKHLWETKFRPDMKLYWEEYHLQVKG